MAASTRNPNIALLERRRALRTLHEFNAANDKAAAHKTNQTARIDAQSAHDEKTLRRRVRT
jgi:hypothetical protein